MDFNAQESKRSYSDRTVDKSWLQWCEQYLNPAGRNIVEIGCGGGIYSRGFATLGAESVIGVDSSAQYVEEARASVGAKNIMTFVRGTAAKSGLPNDCADIVFSRALIHHLNQREQSDSAAEMRRLLRQNGLCVVQDRTQEDIELRDPAYWIRSTLFEVFPHLLDFERARRPKCAE